MQIKWLIIPIGILVLGIVVWMLFGNGEYDIRNAPATGDGPIVAFGDSLVYGVGSSTGVGGFVSILSERLGEEVVNLGRGGDTTATALDRIDEVLVLRPRIVIVLVGGNDAVSHIPHEQTFANLRTIITELQDAGAVVVLLGVRGSLLGDEYKGHFSDLARETGSAYVPDVLDGLFGNSEFMYDQIHPNDAGYERIADRVEPVVRELVQ